MKLWQLVLVVIVVVIISVIIGGFKKVDESNKTYHQQKNDNIVDCTSRGNALDWCLEVFNK